MKISLVRPILYLVAKKPNKEEFPFVKLQFSQLRDGRNNILVSFVGTRHHYSIHQPSIINEGSDWLEINMHRRVTKVSKHSVGSNPVVFTSFDLDKQSSTWDEEIQVIAKEMGLDPEKHIKYYENKLLSLEDFPIFQLGGRSVELTKEKKYPSKKCYYYITDASRIFVETCFTLGKSDKSLDLVVDVGIGELGFVFKGNM
ncbi:MAG: hypothetical protein WAU28_00490 [Candidatus Moraniibacteriota bacterium]